MLAQTTVVWGDEQVTRFWRFLIQQLRDLKEALMKPAKLEKRLRDMNWFQRAGMKNMAAAAAAYGRRSSRQNSHLAVATAATSSTIDAMTALVDQMLPCWCLSTQARQELQPSKMGLHLDCDACHTGHAASTFARQDQCNTVNLAAVTS